MARKTILSIGDEAVKSLEAQQQLALTELLLCEEVDRIIRARLGLPSSATWRRKRLKQLAEFKKPESWGMRPDCAIARTVAAAHEGHVLVAGARTEGRSLYLAANGCDVTTLDPTEDVIERVIDAAAGVGLTGRIRRRRRRRRQMSAILVGGGRREAGGADSRFWFSWRVPSGYGVCESVRRRCGLGLVLLLAFVVMGRGLGASGAFASAAAEIATTVSPDRAQANHYFARYLGSDGGAGSTGWWSSLLESRSADLHRPRLPGDCAEWWSVGQGSPRDTRLVLAFTGGSVMGLGAVLARGCTSGQALTGGALLSVGSWLFIGGAFAAGYAVAPLLRWAWK